MIQKFFHFILLLVVAAPLHAADENIPEELKKIRIEEKLGENLEADLYTFKNDHNEEVKLSQYFKGTKPVVLMMIYYECPSLCNFLLNGFNQAAKGVNLNIGKDFDVVAISINPKEGPEVAKNKKAAYVKEYGRLGSENGWHFLTGSEDQIKAVAKKIGFNYYYDEKIKEYAHSAAAFVFTPEENLSRVLYGINFNNRDLHLALVEASDGKIGSVMDQVLLFCYRYDPNSRGYSFYALNFVRAGGILTVLLMLGYFFGYLRRERKLALKNKDGKDFKEAS
jgi:protein SCO1/2